jgi:hypothetical protein
MRTVPITTLGRRQAPGHTTRRGDSGRKATPMQRTMLALVLGTCLFILWLSPVCAQTAVDIMVNPAHINVRLKGKMHVTVFCSATVAPELIDTDTLALGPGAITPDQPCELEDVNADGCADLVCRFTRTGLGITCADTTLTLTGAFADATTFTGTAAIHPVPCRH